MKNLLISNSRTASAFLLAIGMALGLWSAMAPEATAQEMMTPTAMVESFLRPAGTTIATASREQLLDAVCQAVKRWHRQAPQIGRATAEARPDLRREIFETVFRCLGRDAKGIDCGLYDSVLDSFIAAFPRDAAMFTGLAVDLAPDCASAFGGPELGKNVIESTPVDDGNFGQPPINVLPPPGSIGGGGGSSNLVVICRNGRTIFVSPDRAEEILAEDPGATVGPCQVTPHCNQ